MFKKRWRNCVRGSMGQNEAARSCLTAQGDRGKKLKKKFWRKEGHGHSRGHGLAMPNLWFGVGECFGFFVEFFGYVLVEDCV